jgi:transposase
MMTGLGNNVMTKTEGDGTTSGRRRRRWSRAEKERIVAATMEPGVIASAIAREAGIHASQLFRWRQQLHGAPQYASLTLEVPPDPAPLTTAPMPPGVIEVVFATGARLRISGPVETPIVSAVMQALADCGRR